MLASLWSHPPAEALTLDVRAVPLDPTDPSRVEVGPLVFRGGLWLRSEDPAFGGLSGLEVGADGRQLVAVSDCGRGFTATLELDERGHLVGLVDPSLHDLQGPGGRPLERPEVDAEGLAPDRQGRALVAFEGRPPRIESYALDPPLQGPPQAWTAPTFGEACWANKGPEALAVSAEGAVVVVCEGGGLRPDSTPVWVGHGDGWVERSYPLSPEEPGLHDVYRPTGAVFLPDGDLLVLERRFPPLAIRLQRVRAADVEGEGPMVPEELVRLDPPLSLDNFEGITARRNASGATLLYLLSDDNGCSKGGGVVAPRVQRTLLLVFELRD